MTDPSKFVASSECVSEVDAGKTYQVVAENIALKVQDAAEGLRDLAAGAVAAAAVAIEKEIEASGSPAPPVGGSS